MSDQEIVKAAPLPGCRVNKVIGVVSGKGGVGKSFVTCALAVALARQGKKVAVLDADITGPSVPQAFGIHEKATGDGEHILPAVTKTGIRIMSMNLLLEKETSPVVWRGPVISGTVKQFFSEVVWGEIDCMLVDMPPGTGDVPLTVFQSLPVTGIVIVTSPQDLVSMIVKKAFHMAESCDVPVLGVIENYSYLTCPGCDKRIYPFGEGKSGAITMQYGIPLLAELPIDSAVSAAVDSGTLEDLPLTAFEAAAETLLYLSDGAEPDQDVDAGFADNMKIAVPIDEEGRVWQHFGRTERFQIFETDESGIAGTEILATNGVSHEGLIGFLKEAGADLLICGGLGDHAYNLLQEAGIQVIYGAKGKAQNVLIEFFTGNLRSRGELHKHGAGGCGCEGEN